MDSTVTNPICLCFQSLISFLTFLCRNDFSHRTRVVNTIFSSAQKFLLIKLHFLADKTKSITTVSGWKWKLLCRKNPAKKGNVSFYFSPSKWQVQWYWDSTRSSRELRHRIIGLGQYKYFIACKQDFRTFQICGPLGFSSSLITSSWLTSFSNISSDFCSCQKSRNCRSKYKILRQ